MSRPVTPSRCRWPAFAALLAPAHPRPAAAAVRAAVEAGVLTAIGRRRPLLIDAGVLDAASPVLPLCAAADLVLLAVRDRIEDLVHAAATLDLLADIRPGRRRSVLVVRTTGGLSPSRIGRELGAAGPRRDPHRQLGASVLCGHAVAAPGWARLRLPRAAAGLARKLAGYDPASSGIRGRRPRGGRCAMTASPAHLARLAPQTATAPDDANLDRVGRAASPVRRRRPRPGPTTATSARRSSTS